MKLEFSKKDEVSGFIKIRLVGADLFHTDGHDEAKSLIAILRTRQKMR
jgi:hypothetical protein